MREGIQFGAYLLEAKIAQGGMAEIFRARKLGAKGFSREVCIKRIRPALCNDRAFVEMFIDEAHTSSKLRHSNIVAIDDFGELDGQLFACMEWVNGTDLSNLQRRLLEHGELMPTDAALFVIGEVLKALEYAHAKIDQGKTLDIVHRDVTPHNVLVSYSGEVKLTDFGIAKASSRLHQTHGDVIKGKVSYMAPEQARGLSLDGRVDLFAMGVVSFELLAGQRPFVGAREGEVVMALLRNERVSLSSLRPDLPLEVVDFVDRLLAPAREARYPNATAALDALSTLAPSTGARTLANLLAEYFPDRASVVRDAGALRKSVPVPVRAPAPPTAPAPLGPTVELRGARAIPVKPLTASMEPADGTDPSAPPEMPIEDVGDLNGLTAVDRHRVREDTESHFATEATPIPAVVPSARIALERARTDRVVTATGALPQDPSEPPRAAVTITTMQRVEPETFEPQKPTSDPPYDPPPDAPQSARSPWLIAAAVPLLVAVVGFLATRTPRPTPEITAPTVAPTELPRPRAAALDAHETPTHTVVSAVTPLAQTLDAGATAAREEPAWLTVVVRPWGSVSVDGRPYGESRAVVRLAPGRHRVQGAQGENLRAEAVILRAGERRQVVINMQ